MFPARTKHIHPVSRLNLIRRSPGGFTLIELLMAVGVIAMLTSLAYPSYQNHLRHAHRTEAQATMMAAAHFMQRKHLGHHRYDDGDDNLDLLPPELQQSPKQGQAQYVIHLSAVNAQTYTLRATPSSAGVMAQDPCGSLTLNQHQVKGLIDSAKTVSQCWR